MNDYVLGILMFVGINTISVCGLHIITGMTGLFSLAQATFAGIGAYSAALMTLRLGAPFPVALLVGMIMACLLSVVVGYPSLRLRGDYLCIATLGFGEVVRISLLNLEFTGGGLGLSGIKAYTDSLWVGGILVVVLASTVLLTRSRVGRAWIAIREDELAAESFGANLGFYKLLAFVVGGGFAGLAGGLYAHYLLYVNPADFGINKSVEVLLFIIIGGVGSLPGAIIGVTLLQGVPEFLRFLSEYRVLVYAVTLVIIIVYKPMGILGNVRFSDLFDRLRARYLGGFSGANGRGG